MRHILTTVLLMLAVYAAKAQQTREQQTKEAAIADGSLYEDIVNIPFDDKGLDLTVHITFDEVNNELTLSLVGSRQLFVFQDDTQRKKAFTGFWSRRTLRPERLGYPTLTEPKTKYKLTTPVVKSFNKPRTKHLFNKWITKVSSNLTPVEEGVSQLTPDSIVKKFLVAPTATKASFTLRNILVLDTKEELAAAAEKRNHGKTLHYRFVLDNDLATTYNVSIKRDPCLFQQPAIDSVNARIDDISEAYHRLHKSCPTGKATSQTEVNIFNQHRQYLLSKYRPIVDSTKCDNLMSAYKAYNNYVDSIKEAPCICIVADNSPSALSASIGVNTETLLSTAKRLDDIVATIMVSHDQTEIRDLRNLGRDIIRIVNANVSNKGLRNEEQRKAFAMFRKAEEYFLAVIMKL